MERLNKVLALSGITSRRGADELISSGRVKVNDVTVSELGFKVKKDDVILVDGMPINKVSKKYYILNKPKGCLSTTIDDKNRKTILDFFTIEDRKDGVYPIGRLDFDAAGLLILTNDGELTKALTRPNLKLEKEYMVRVKGIVIKEKIRQMRLGMKLEDGSVCKPKEVQLVELDKPNQTTLIRIVLLEQKNKEVKLLIKSIGHEVKSLTRVRLDGLTIEGVARGTYRPLKPQEIKQLKSYL